MEQDFLAHTPGEPVAEVDLDDLKAVWQLMQVSRRHAERVGTPTAIGGNFVKGVCKPGANPEAVIYRAMMLGLVEKYAAKELATRVEEGELHDHVFQVAATIPMEWIGVGITRNGFPFDIEEFKRRVRAANHQPEQH